VKPTERSAKCTPTSVPPYREPEQRIFDGTRSYTGSASGLAARNGLRCGDTSSMRARLTSSHFVGRIAELAELELAFADATGCRPALVLLGGDSGVGKTRLILEFERRATAQDVLVLRGDAVEQGQGELPYAPLLGALRPVVRERHPALSALTPGSAAQLAALLPGLGDGRVRADRDDLSAQLRLFEALLELLDLLSDAGPLVLILEDLHWADRSTSTFVAFLARSLRQERLLLLLTYRSDELYRRHALRPLLGELERLERARRIQLEPFDRDELAEALADILGDTPSRELVERLYARSEGNPLYTEELLAAGLDGRGTTPRSLHDAFMLRIERLSAVAQGAARVIAVGRRLEEATIAEVTGIEHEALHAALREAVAEQVLVAGDDGRLLFRHALLREAVYDDLLPGERGELHLALARALEHRAHERPDESIEVATTIANHYASAGDQPDALRATFRAAVAAGRVHAYCDAADLLERALGLWPRVPDAATMLALDRAELLSRAARAHGLGGDRARGEALLEAAVRELDPGEDPLRYAGLLARLARAQWALNGGLVGVETAQHALSMIPEDDMTGERAALLGWLARTRFLRGRFRDAIADAEDARAAAVAAGDLCAEGEVLNTLGMAQIALGDVDDGVAKLRRAQELARESDDMDDLASAYINLADMLGLAGRTASALATAREGLTAIPSRSSRSRDYLMLTVSDLAFEAGDWDTARELLSPQPATPLQGRLLIYRRLHEAELALGEGELDVTAGCLREIEELVAHSSEPQWHGPFGALLAELRRRRHDLDGARTAIAEALDRLELCTDDVARIATVTAVGVRVEADIAERGRDLREKQDERGALARARIHVQRLRAAAQAGGPVEQAYVAVGAAELARARGRNDPALWRKAAAKWDEIARPYPAAIARWREAEAEVEAGDRTAATDAAQAAFATAGRLGARWLAEEVGALAARARLEVGEQVAPAGNGARPDVVEADPFGLTPRERQVLALIAEGATNRQIGSALYMAEKTASVHVSRILSKLGVRSRTQAAAVAHRLHLS